ncbi:hypothetical protein M3204_13820 [Mesobacillus subterraneus]|uniref:hypothetical protein n=1 Tax=Mesobacillus subterraneus TaxID=285983 RepID=UPI0020411350|nr:hypothetical protein [Mesobacillus subterraneus]MCM3665490.1 hypothetical protein [Mesobacillus subterraneus]MCM3686049.1 hypothetical protein [Mesobacillus subterraneus]
MFRQKQEIIKFSDFMNKGKDIISVEEMEIMKKGKTAGYAFGLSMLPLAIAPLTQATTASAHEAVTVMAQGQMYDKMIIAFNPLIDLIQALAYPIAMVVVLGGAIMVMINQKEKGYSMMMGAGLGYVLVNMTPMILNILVDAMKSVV